MNRVIVIYNSNAETGVFEHFIIVCIGLHKSRLDAALPNGNHRKAKGGFTDGLASAELALDFPPALLEKVPQDKRDGLCATLRADPRPRYQDDPERVYGLVFGGQNVRFRVIEGVVTVVEVEKP